MPGYDQKVTSALMAVSGFDGLTLMPGYDLKNDFDGLTSMPGYDLKIDFGLATT